MGLAGPKKRTRIGHDPNNTTWTSATSRYGHRMLLSAGWKPGSTLGAKDAAHSAHYTAGSDSHIRITPCVEGKGLGAKKTTDDTFGLRLLSGLLGRLNGQDTTAIEQQLDRRRGEGYIEQRGWGLHFVFGGLLVGDKVEKEQRKVLLGPVQTKNKKRKVAHDENSQDVAEPVLKKKKKAETSSSSDDDVLRTQPSQDESAEAKLIRKQARAQRKEARRLKREQKELRKAQKARTKSEKAQDPTLSTAKEPAMTPDNATVTSASGSGASTPLFAGGRGRHAMRQKYIDQKRMACMDDKALNEIFMIKSGV